MIPSVWRGAPRYNECMPFVSVPEAVEEIRAGRILIVVDDEDRENEGDLTVAAEKITPEIINFMATHGRGLICLALTPERCDYLRLPAHEPVQYLDFRHRFLLKPSMRATGVTTGISAADRTRTILIAIDPACRPPTWPAPATSSRCAPAKAACWCAPDRPRPPSISRGWPASRPPASSAKS